MKNLLVLCSFSILTLNQCNAANILVFIPTPFYSHHSTYYTLWVELARKGHHITLLTRHMFEKNENITQLDLSEVYKLMERTNFLDKLRSGEHNILKIFYDALEFGEEFIDFDLSHPKVQKLSSNNETYDLVISEFIVGYGFTFGKKFNAPYIAITTLGGNSIAHNYMGNPTHPVLYTEYDLPFYKNLNFKQRIISVLFSISLDVLNKFFIIPLEDKVLTKYFEKLPSIDEISKHVSIFFINANPIFNDVRPLGPNTVNIGGFLHLSKSRPKPLTKDLQGYLDSSTEGVIYFSLGSSIKSKDISNKTKRVILETFSQLPYKVLWKFEKEELEGKPSNVKIKTWLPQQDVMKHKNIKLFITQGGLQSMEEALYHHIPMIGLPFYGDQYNNVNRMVEHKFGLSLDHTNLKVDELKESILEVINNPSYKQKTQELVDLILDQPMTGLEKAVWWTEYVIRHKGALHFRNPVVDLPFYQYYLLDVISFIALVLLCIIFVFYLGVKLLRKLFRILYVQFVSDKTKQD